MFHSDNEKSNNHQEINKDSIKNKENSNNIYNPLEIGGPAGPEPTRYGDWEKNGRVSDF